MILRRGWVAQPSVRTSETMSGVGRFSKIDTYED